MMTGIGNASQSLLDDIFYLSMQMCLVGAIVCVCAGVQSGGLKFFCERQLTKMRIAYFDAVLQRDMSWFDSQEIAALPLTMSDDLEKIAEAFGDKVGVSIQSFFAFITSFFCAFYFGWQIALVTMAMLPFIAVGAALMGAAVQETQNETQSWYAKASGIVEEGLFALRTVVAFGGERKELSKFEAAMEQARKGGVKNGLKIGAGMGYTMMIVFFGYALAFWYGMTLMYDDVKNPATGEPYQIGTILSVFFCVFIGSFMIGNVEPGAKAMQQGRVSAYRMFMLLDTPALIESKSEDDKRMVLDSLTSFEFKNVTFSYPARPEAMVLNSLNLTVKQGQHVAVVGESGSGKSTIMGLLERFYDVKSGEVLVNGTNIKSVSVRSLRKLISYVGQEPVLFATSIRDNILQGNPDASNADLEDAVKDAELTFVANLPEKLDTFVGSAGSQFSGGQKQRIAIARALVKKASVLFLDEATSALDNKSEQMIQGTIDRISKKSSAGLTIVSIAHRLSTIQGADVIYVLSKGVVVESGTHAELISLQGMYSALVEAQKLAMSEKQEEMERAVSGDKDQLKTVSLVSGTDSRPMRSSIGEQKVEDDRRKNIAKTYKVPMGRLFGYNKNEWPFLVPAFLGAAVDGCCMPLCAVLLIQSMQTMLSGDKELMKLEMEKIALYSVGLGLLQLCAMIMEHGSLAVLSEAMAKRLRVKLLSTFFRQEVGFHDNPANTPGILGQALEVNAYRATVFSRSLGAQTASTCSLCCGLTIAFYYSWQMSCAMLASLPIMIGANALQMVIMLGGSKNENEALKRAQQMVSESVQNPRTVKACGSTAVLVDTYKDDLLPTLRGPLNSVLAGSVFGFVSSIQFFIMAGGFYFAGWLVSEGIADFQGTMTAFMGIFYAAMGAGQAAAFLGDSAKAKVAAHDMFALIDRKSEIDSLDPIGEVPTVAIEAGCIEFEDVCFQYPFRPDVKVLMNLSFKVEQGQAIGLCGPSGGGKSTLMSLLQRFYDPASGKVLIGKERSPLENFSIRWWRRQVGFVGQEPVLFDTTVRANLLYGLNEGEDISEEKLAEYTKMANLDFLNDKDSDGLETLVGPRGSRLSGGQKQRVAICRALVRNPAVLLLDEATSALDTTSEKVVQQALDVAKKGRTSFAIAHRLSTIADCDRIMVVGEGRVLESGTHTELMNLKGVYSKLVNAGSKQ
eukprot:TRINITY_DN25678_c0_g2_i1.p1 TRINITY_DN25678_c0_g2~~TRINITY_DN25678_c0_g2_i1.p1  ORF type:complete len:1307 (+),score=203.20 TRINITY_DN25678_c0_g2_i1:353-3922(+)